MKKINKAYLTEQQVSDLTQRAVQSLRNDRFLRRGIPYIKWGRSVYYSLEDCIAFMEARKIETEDSRCDG